MLKKPIEIFCVELELAPYKFDLWNEFSDSKKFNVTAFFTEEKNYDKDASHNYLSFPIANFKFTVESGKTLISKLRSVQIIFNKIINSKYQYIYISGYNHLVTFTSVLLCIFFKKPFFLNTDLIVFRRKKIIQNSIKKYFLRKANKILLCNRLFSDKEFLIKQENIVDFTYYVSKKRLLNDKPENIPNWLEALIENQNNTIIFVSSRLIPRKGCDTLLHAFNKIKNTKDVFLLIEGDGIQYRALNEFIAENNSEKNVKMLGFNQYKTHSWLIRNSDIVIVPSHEDNWGIVVDEGLKLNKLVISTYSTGSAVTLIKDKVNGFLYESNNEIELRKLIEKCILISKKTNTKSYNSAIPREKMSEILYNNIIS